MAAGSTAGVELRVIGAQAGDVITMLVRQSGSAESSKPMVIGLYAIGNGPNVVSAR